MKKLITIALLLNSFWLRAQTEAQNWGISWSGFIKTDAIYDSRQTVAFREGHFLLYPQNENPDVNGDDINAKANFNILAIQTRLQSKITGPDAFGAKTSGLIEAEFFGTTDADVNGFRLRHTFVKLDWANTTLLVGQTWHPMFVTEMFPGVVSFNTGAPFQPFSRNPQIRLTRSVGNLKLICAALSQRDFTSNGPDGFSSAYLRNSVLPNLHAQVQYADNGHLVGAGVDFKKLTPRLATAKKVITDQSVGSISAIGYAKLQLQPVTIKSEVVYGGNLADHLMLGGYAVKSTTTSTGAEAYTPLQVLAIWGEIATGTDIEVALFGGFTKNLGGDANISGSYFGRGVSIDKLIRLAPRIQWNSGKTRIATELEYTQAGYGAANNLKKGVVEDVKDVANLRLLFAVYYFF